MSTDYIIVGGSLSAQVLAARLREYEPNVSITLVVAETSPNGTTSTRNSSQCPCKQGDERSESDQSSSDCVCFSSLVQRLMFPLTTSTRSLSWRQSGFDDYNTWAQLVQDPRWSYDSLQPYFQRIESELESGAGNFERHEKSPHTQLGDIVRRMQTADTQSPSHENERLQAANRRHSEAYTDGALFSAGSYSLKEVDLIRLPIRRLLFSRKIARGVELQGGRRIIARRDVIIAAGAIETARLLLLSGIGPLKELAAFGIDGLVNAPVGQNLHGHSAFLQRYEISNETPHLERDMESLHTLGSPIGNMVTASVKPNTMRRALRADKRSDTEEAELLLSTNRSHIRICPLYEPLSTSDVGQSASRTLAIATVNVTPTSRGTVQLASADPEYRPLVKHNHLASETDRVIFRQGIRLATRMFAAPLARTTFWPIPGSGDLEPLSSTSPPEVIDAWLEESGLFAVSTSGTAAMGRVVDTNLKVIGTERLRIVDESVIPCPIASDYRAAACVIAEQAAVLIALSWSQTDDCTPI